MKPYHKIKSVFKRDPKTHKFIIDEYTCPEFEYLKDCSWDATEKVDGTNIRVIWDGETVRFAGRTDNAQMPVTLYDKLTELFPVARLAGLYADLPMCLYGEGYGKKIQKGGGNYNKDGVDFVLFDVKIDNWWLRRDDCEDIANKLSLRMVPTTLGLTLPEAIKWTRDGIISHWGQFAAEGLVLRPRIGLYNRNSSRIILKMKTKDF